MRDSGFLDRLDQKTKKAWIEKKEDVIQKKEELIEKKVEKEIEREEPI